MENNSYFLTSLLLLMILYGTSCEKPDVTEDKELMAKLYTIADDTISIEGHKYILETYLYRDFFPGVPIPRKSPLIADIYLVNLDSVMVSENLEVTNLYVIQDPLIWISGPGAGVQTDTPVFKLNKLSRDGPEWTTNTYVDAVIKIVNSVTKEEYFLLARNQYIERVE